MVSKRRAAHSEKHSQAKYSEELVIMCRELRNGGMLLKDISEISGISEKYLSTLCKGTSRIYTKGGIRA